MIVVHARAIMARLPAVSWVTLLVHAASDPMRRPTSHFHQSASVSSSCSSGSWRDCRITSAWSGPCCPRTRTSPKLVSNTLYGTQLPTHGGHSCSPHCCCCNVIWDWKEPNNGISFRMVSSSIKCGTVKDAWCDPSCVGVYMG